MQVLTEICQHLHNWFDRKPNGERHNKYSGAFTVFNGEITELSGELASGQYYRIMGSLFNDGVHKYGDEADTLTDEAFEGVIWAMGVPPVVVSLADEISAWKAKYEALDSEAMSPFTSESFGGYSYSKSAGGSGTSGNGGSSTGWQSVFANRLAPWRKI